MNHLKTTVLLGVLTLFFLWAGHILAGRSGMTIALVVAVAADLYCYRFSDRWILRMYNAQELTPAQTPELYAMLETLCRKAHLPEPRVFLISQKSPNAFATGRNPDNATIVITEGLLSLLDRKEMIGVLGHELAHIKNRDTLTGMVSAAVAGAVMASTNAAGRKTTRRGAPQNERGYGKQGILGWIEGAILAPLAALFVRAANPRSREYLADAAGMKLAGSPEGLASALEKLGDCAKTLPLDAAPATSHLFIVNPLGGKNPYSLFSTHPSLDQRIARLKNTGGSGMQSKKISTRAVRATRR